MEMESMLYPELAMVAMLPVGFLPHIAYAPGDCAFLCCSSSLICLTFDAYSMFSVYCRCLKGLCLTKIHDVIPTDGAVVDDDIPCPESDSIPL
jgi:hypothetical protein